VGGLSFTESQTLRSVGTHLDTNIQEVQTGGS
jgi:hypothetical protein